MAESIRARILSKVLDLVSNVRFNIYGEPTVNLKLQGELQALYRKYCPEGKYSPGHDAAIFSIFIKLGRIATGSYHRDNYEDGAGYFAIAAECEEATFDKPAK